MIGKTIGQYRVTDKVGEGGMGIVYRATDTQLGREVAIKVLPATYSTNTDRLRRFEQEAQAAGALNHPNILVIYHIGSDDGAPYIVSELLDGETLRDRLAGGSLSQRKAIDYALQMAHGLAAAHEKGIIHRDLKPENVFVTKDGRIKILDFGLAKLLGENDGSRALDELSTRRVATDPGVVMGTIGYMSPEQLRGRPADHRSDIFSFGAILYEMLSGKRAFRGDSTADTMSAILREDPPDLSSTNQNIAPALERIVNHCLEKSPDERFHSANDLGFAIESLSGSGQMSPSTATAISHLPPLKRQRRELFAWIATGFCLLGMIGLAVLYFQRSRADNRPMRFVVALPDKATDLAFPIISPDGQTLAFVATTDGRRKIYVRPIDSINAQPLSGTEYPVFPFWSPDSHELGFFSGNKLKRINIGGQALQIICEAKAPGGGTWNSNGDILVAVDNQAIQRVPASGGSPTAVFRLDESRKERSQFWPVFLPDGRHFLYQSWTGHSEESTLYVGSIDGAERKFLLKTDSNPAYAAPGYLLFAREGTVLAQPFDASRLQLGGEPVPVAEHVTFINNYSLSNFSVSQTGMLVFVSGNFATRQLVWFDRNGKQLGLAGPAGEYYDIALSPDEKRLLIQADDGSKSDLWLMDLTRGAISRFTFGGNEDDPVWSSDGNAVGFSSVRDGLFDLYQKASSGAKSEEPLFKSGESKEMTDWSPDGKVILFDRYDAKGNLDVWAFPLSGDKSYPLLQSPFQEGQGHFSPDGHWFAYTSNE